MTILKIYPENQPSAIRTIDSPDGIARELERIGVVYEHWDVSHRVPADAEQDEIIEAYHEDIDRLMQRYGFGSVDVVRMTTDHPNWKAVRERFLDEHTHGEDEFRFFVEGSGRFYIHSGGRVYCIDCRAGDLVGVPGATPHWFDMGEPPHFIMIRLFTRSEFRGSYYTGSDIAQRFTE